jgi:cation diffusion facilitator CzcD-associated flavoprotein CzcO
VTVNGNPAVAGGARPRVAILGAGPVGLEAALAAADAGWPFTVYESAPQVGGNVRRWGHVRLFTPWTMNVSDRMARHLRAAGMPVPGGGASYPCGTEFAADLLEPLAKLPALAGRIEYGTRVAGVGRQGLLKHEEIATEQRAARPFRIVLDRAGEAAVTTASLVLDCTGNYTTPNAAGDGGVPAPGEEDLGDRIVRTMPDLGRDAAEWAGKTILLIGAGKSAQTAARDLAGMLPSAPGTEVIWAVRATEPGWGEIADDPLPQRQALVDSSRRLAAGEVAGFRVVTGTAVDAFKPEGGRILVRLTGGDGAATGSREVLADRVLSLTGYVPDTSVYRQLQVHECYATSAPIELAAQLLGDAAGDCLAQPRYGVDVLRNPEPDFFVLGVKSYGRNNQFLLRVGYEQVAEVFGAYTGDGGPG